MTRQPIALHGHNHDIGGQDPFDVVYSVSSADGSVVITNPDGPVVDLSTSIATRAERQFLTASVTVLANNANGFFLTYIFGDSVLDLSNPFQPTIATNGVYLMAATVNTTDPVQASRHVDGGITLVSVISQGFGGNWTTDSTNVASVAGMHWDWGGILYAGDYMQGNINNYDSIPHTFNIALTVTLLH